jgi:UrcA family protein
MRLFLAAGLAALTSACAVADPPRGIKVATSDLVLPRDRAVLDERIEKAARDACTAETGEVRRLVVLSEIDACVRETVAHTDTELSLR